MVKKNLKLKIGLITLATLVPISSICAAIPYIVNNKNTINNNVDSNKPVVFNNKSYDSVLNAYEDTKRLLNQKQIDDPNAVDLYQLKYDNQTKYFDNPTDISNFFNSKIKVIKTQTDIKSNSNINILASDGEILDQYLYRYNIDTVNQTAKPIKKSFAYQGKNNNVFSTLNYNNDTDAKNAAKDSFVQIHKCYYFNGIYFKSKNDLERYLLNEYYNDISRNLEQYNQNKNFRRLNSLSSNNKEILSEPIQVIDMNTNLALDAQARKSEIIKLSDFLATEAKKYVAFKTNNGNIYLDFNENGELNTEPVDKLIQLSNLNDFGVVSQKSNDNNNLYVVDAKYDEEYNFIGPYFLKTNSDIDGITNYSNWTQTEDNPVQIARNQSINMLGAFFETLLINPSLIGDHDKILNRFIGLTSDQNGNYFVRPEHSLFNIVNYLNDEQKQKLLNLEANMYKQLQKVKPRISNAQQYNSLYDFIISTYRKLLDTKRYNQYFSIPLLYHLIMEEAVDAQADLDTIFSIKNYFNAVCDGFQNLLETIFGKEILVDFETRYSDKKQYFNIKEFFGIDQFDYDPSTIGSHLESRYFIKKYKYLYAACYTFIRCFFNGQQEINFGSTLKPNIEEWDEMFSVLSDGNADDQANINVIKDDFKNHIVNKKTNLTVLGFLESFYSNFINSQNDLYTKIKNNSKAIDYFKKISENKEPSFDKFEELNNMINETVDVLTTNLIDKINPLIDGSVDNSKWKESFVNICESNLKAKTVVTSMNFVKTLDEFHEFKINPAKCSMTNTFKKIQTEHLDITQSLLNDDNYEKDVQVIKQAFEYEKVAEECKNIVNTISSELHSLGSLSNAILNSIAISQNKFYPPNIQAKLIAKNIMNFCGSICDVLNNILPAPANFICQAISAAFSIITGILGSAEQVIYEYKLPDPSSNIKYYWDGGLVNKSLWGLISVEERGIQDIKLATPIKIVEQRSKDTYYFDGCSYNSSEFNKIRHKISENIVSKIKTSQNDNIVYSVFDKNDPNFTNCQFNNIINNQSLQTPEIDSLAEYVYDKMQTYALNESQLNLDSFWRDHILKLNNKEMFFNGVEALYKINNKETYILEANAQVLNNISPTYILQKPNIDNNNYINNIYKSENFELPKPYFSSDGSSLDTGCSTKESKRIVWPDTQNYNANQNFFIYNANALNDNSINHSLQSIAEQTLKAQFRKSVNIRQKEVCTNSLLTADNFETSFTNSLYPVNVYAIQNPLGDYSYFLDEQKAREKLLYFYANELEQTNGVRNFKVQLQKQNVLTFVYNNQEIYFKNINDFNNWFKYEIINIMKGEQ